MFDIDCIERRTVSREISSKTRLESLFPVKPQLRSSSPEDRTHTQGVATQAGINALIPDNSTDKHVSKWNSN